MTCEIYTHPAALKALEQFSLPEGDIGFGKLLAPIMFQCVYKDQQWLRPEIVPYGPVSLDPTSKVLHYGQEIFEGMKAYRTKDDGPFLFRPERNWQRFNSSGARIGMPPIPKDIFLEGVKTFTQLCKDFIPQQSGESLYIRPFMFATDRHLGIKPSESFLFLIVASPSASYFSGEIKVLIERDMIRAFPKGTGNAKVGGNYAAGLLAGVKAQQHGVSQTLWLDATERKYIEELSGMNFFCVIRGEIITPSLTDSILPGITRESVIQLARHAGYQVREERIAIDQLLDLIKTHECTEAFSSGTASIIGPIRSFHEESGEVFELPQHPGPISMELREQLLQIQEGRGDDPFGWRVTP